MERHDFFLTQRDDSLQNTFFYIKELMRLTTIFKYFCL
jgi:hypothetical protein